jgi:hypothetical protein
VDAVFVEVEHVKMVLEVGSVAKPSRAGDFTLKTDKNFCKNPL